MTQSFHTLFLECKALLNNYPAWKFVPVGSKKEIISKLDKMLTVFPDVMYKDLLSIHFSFDDTVRLVSECAPVEKQLDLFKKLFNEFSVADTCISHGIVDKGLVSKAEDNIEEIKKEVLLKWYKPSGENEDFVKELMRIAYNIEV